MTHDRREVETFDKALVVYLEAVGEGAEQPAGDSQYDAERGGWLLENIRGPLALVRNDGTIIWPVRDEHGDRVIPDEEEIGEVVVPMIDQKYAEARLRVFIEQLSEDEKQLDEEALFRRAQDALRNDRRFRLAAARAVFRRLVATHGNSFGVNPPF